MKNSTQIEVAIALADAVAKGWISAELMARTLDILAKEAK